MIKEPSTDYTYVFDNDQLNSFLTIKIKAYEKFNPLFVIALMVMMSSNNSHAQTVNQSAWMVGGSLGFSTWKYKGEDNSYTWFNFAPNVGYYFMDDFAAGLEMDYVSISYDGNSNSSFFLSPFFRYYITDPFFAQLS